MGVWLYEETAPWAFSPADEMTTIKALLIARGALEPDDAPAGPAQIIDLRAYRLARLGEGGPDA